MASDIFAKIGDIKGESLDDKHKGEIEVLSWSWGVTNAGDDAGGSGGGEGKATFHDLSFTHNIDKASPVLMQACATGVHLKEATITHRKAGKGQQEFLVIKMNDVIITSVDALGRRREAASESVSMVFAKVDLRVQAAEGRRLARCRPPLQVRHQGQQGRLARAAVDRAPRACTRLATHGAGAYNGPRPQPRRGDVDRHSAAAERAVVGRCGRSTAASSKWRPTMPMRCITRACSPISRQRGEEAVALIERSLELEPDRADWHSNLGIVLQDRLRAGRRPIAAYRRAIALDPDHANAHNNLGVVLRAQDKPVEAEAAYRIAIRINPEHSDAYHNLGVLLNGQKRHPRGDCLLLQGHHAEARAPRGPEAAGAGALHARRGRQGRGRLRGMAARGAGRSHRAHMLAACSGRDVPPRASDAFVEKTFDSFAASFDSQPCPAPLPRAGARRRDAGAIGRPAIQVPRRPRCRMRHGIVRTADRAVRAATRGSRPVRPHARPGAGA